MGGVPGLEFLELLARDASPVEFEGPVVAARGRGASAEELAELEQAKAVALQVQAVLAARRRRETELSALYETAGDLAALTDIDAVLQAIVRRVRSLLHCDVAYLSLNDDQQGDTYIRVTEGSIAPSFQAVRLPMGAGLGGLVAQTATAYSTPDYFDDERFEHTHGIDSAVADEGLRSILGVPLRLGQQVIGVLYAANRDVRPFDREAVALLSSLAAHAAVAIDNARLLSETQHALSELEHASALLRRHTDSVERAADAHDRLTRIVAHGGDAEDVVREIHAVLDGPITVVDPDDRVVAASSPEAEPAEAELAVAREARAAGRTVEQDGVAAAPVLAGTETLGALVLRHADDLSESDRRILERSALVTALLLLFRRNVAAAEARVRGELLEDVLSGATLDRSALHERVRLLGADPHQSYAVVVAEVVGDRLRAAQAATHFASVQGGFAAVREGYVIAILPDRAPAEAARLLGELLRRGADTPVTVGAAGPVAGIDAVLPGYDEARRCLSALLALGRSGEVATTDDLGFVGLLLGGGRDARDHVVALLGPVLDYDAQRGTSLVETLETYFRVGGNLTRSASELHVHVNTVAQRLERVTRLLGEQWQEPEHLLEVQLALRLHRLTA